MSSWLALYCCVLVLNCIRLLTRLIPYIFEDVDWSGFFWSPIPNQSDSVSAETGTPLAHTLIEALCVSRLLLLVLVMCYGVYVREYMCAILTLCSKILLV